MIDSEFTNPVPHKFRITRISRGESINSARDRRLSSAIAQPVTPITKSWSEADGDHIEV
jgi:hypothetical protein